jgi:hypothetical protein
MGEPRRTPPAGVPHFTTEARGRTRVVVEDVDEPSRLASERILRKAGFDVVGCGGPETISRRRCPLEEGMECPAISDADVIVTALRLGADRMARVVAGIRDRYPDTPLVVRAPSMVAHRHRDLLQDARVVGTHTPSVLVEAVEEVVAARA